MYRLLIILIGLFASAGMCDEMTLAEEEDSAGDAGVVCPDEICQNLIAVEIIRADNMGFQTGIYEFSATLPDLSEFSIACDLGFQDGGFACSMGDVSIMNVQLSMSGATIQMNLLFAVEAVTVAVYYNGLEIGQRTIVPVYDDTNEANPDCPVNCLPAEDSIPVESW